MPTPSVCKFFTNNVRRTAARGPTPEEIKALKPSSTALEQPDCKREWHRVLSMLMAASTHQWEKRYHETVGVLPK